MSAEYSLAMSEVLCIINQSDDNYKSKIPQSFISFLKENADSTYNPDFNVNIPIKELDLRKETKGLLALIHRSYICNEEERVEYDKILKQNEEKMQKIMDMKERNILGKLHGLQMGILVRKRILLNMNFM